MSVASCIDKKTAKIVEEIKDIRRNRQQLFDAGRAEERAAWNTWNQRCLQAKARGESFDEPVPGSEEDEAE